MDPVLNFASRGNESRNEYQILIETQVVPGCPRQIFKVGTCSDAALEYKLKRIRRAFPGLSCFIRRTKTTTDYGETEKFKL